MTNVQNWRRLKTDPVYKVVASATVIEKGDLLFEDPTTRLPEPASDMIDQGSPDLNEDAFQQYFLGVAGQQSRSGDTAEIQVHVEGEFEFDCAAAQFRAGDMVSVYETATNVLGDQAVKAETAESRAIGVVAKDYTSNTTKVLVRIRSTILRNALQAQVVGSSSGAI